MKGFILWRISQKGLLSVLVLACSLSLSVSSQANAVSAYDDFTPQILTDTLTVGYPAAGSTMPYVDVSLNWLSYVGGSDPNNYSNCSLTDRQAILDSIDAGQYEVVQQLSLYNSGTNNHKKTVDIFYNINGASFTGVFGGGTGYDRYFMTDSNMVDNWHKVTLDYKETANGNNVDYIVARCNQVGNVEHTYQPSASASANQRLIYMSSVIPTYPDGYTGSSIPTTGAQDPPTLNNDPLKWSFEVIDKTLKLDVDETTIPEGYTCKFIIDTNPAIDGDDLPLQTVDADMQNCSVVFSYTFDENGKYYVQLYAIHPSENDKFASGDITIDGSSYSGFVDQNGMSLDSLYENCGIYGADLIGGWGCTMRNFGTYLMTGIKSLFVPSQSSLTTAFDAFKEMFIEKLGFLSYPLVFIVSLFDELISNSSPTACTPMSFSGTLFGGTVSMDPCALQQVSSDLFNFGRLILQATTIMALIYAFHRKYLEVLNR